MDEQRKAKHQYKKFRYKMKQYVLQELQNPEDIIVLVQYLKYSIPVLDTSRTTAISTEDDKDPIMVMIQTEEIKQYAKKIHDMTENHQALWANVGTVLYSIAERIVRRSRLHNTFTNI